MLTNTSRTLTYLVSILYALLGVVLFFLPEQMAPLFAWKVTGFMTMTIGGWCLGNAWLAFFAARRWEWRLVQPALIYLWTFGILETLIVILFRAKLQLVHPIAWLYMTTLAVNILITVLGITDWFRIRPSAASPEGITGFFRFVTLGFIVFVGWLGLYGLIAKIGWLGTNGEIFPEVMSAFTLRSFGAFYFFLTVGMLPVLFGKSMTPFVNYAFLAIALIVIIMIAAFAYLPLFDFQDHPFGTLYFAAYLVAGVLSVVMFAKYGTGVSIK